MRLADKLVSALLEMPGVEEAPSQFNAVPALWVDGREFANLHPGVVHVRLTRKQISAMSLTSDERVTLRSTDWIHVRLRTAADLVRAIDLARAAVEANRARPGKGARATPDDRELIRRRRSHRSPTTDLAP